jgi:hypothetical protein
VTDWLSAVDDHLCQRLRCCTDCGQATTTVWVGVVELAHHRSVAYAICPRCKAKEGGEDALRARLERRYASAQGAC